MNPSAPQDEIVKSGEEVIASVYGGIIYEGFDFLRYRNGISIVIVWLVSSPSVDVGFRIFLIFIVVGLVHIDLKYLLFESESKWKRKRR
jgi:hypothetical protein